MSHQALHEALRTEEVGTHSSSGLHYVVVKLQRGKSDIRHTLHAWPTLVRLSGRITPADVLHHLGFSHGPCAFLNGGQCIAREVPADFNLHRFAEVVDTGFRQLEEGIKLLLDCGFYVEHRLFGQPLPRAIQPMLVPSRGDAHNAPKKQMMKATEDDFFEFKLTWIEGGADKGWTFHYRPKHVPSVEVATLLSFLQLKTFGECPEYDFEPCLWRLCGFYETGDAFHGPAEIAHRWFDAHATKFSPGVQKLLDAHASLATFGLELLPTVRTNVPPEVVQSPQRSDKRPVRPSAPGGTFEFDIAISFAGPQRSIAESIATHVKNSGFSVFYDAFFPEQLWGKDLPVFFDEVFRTKSRYCLIVISRDYVERDWTNRERQSAVERAIKERGREYILPLKVDDAELPGVPGTIGYVSLDEYTPEQVADMLVNKLRL
jgi:hypothetical protein